MRTIIIGDGLTDDVINPEERYTELKSSVGRPEIDRLIGRGRHFGHGPLPSFLHNAAKASNESDINIILLVDRESDVPSTDEHFGNLKDIATPIKPVAESATIIPTTSGIVPWREIVQEVQRLACIDPLKANAAECDIRFLLVGCHTEKRILATATFLRNVLGFSDVSISSHLSGSAAREAHFAALRHTFPSFGIRVLLDLVETAEYVSIDASQFQDFVLTPCIIKPAEIVEMIGEEQKRIVELLCLNWTEAHLKPLAGGYSGSLLFIADGYKGAAHTEPIVIKIDNFGQMRREITGYHHVKDFLGKHIPTFGYPISLGESIGISMELAAMEGAPESLQDTFEEAHDEESFSHFMHRLNKTLDLISEKLYVNTHNMSWFAPYRRFHLHADIQLEFLDWNLSTINKYLDEEKLEEYKVSADNFKRLLKVIASNEDGVESDTCIAHGDLNYQNVICDQADNIWFIDWTHCGQHPIEKDFAKFENDVKFVMSKQFDLEDLPRLKQFEEYLIANRIPASSRDLPENLKFVKWDLRYSKILTAVRRIRETLFSLKQSDDWLVYRIALLGYSLHTISFDKRQGNGDCELQALMHALFSIEELIFSLISDDFHLKIRGERPSSYPARYRISIDEAPWTFDCDEYSPPYHVDATVLASDRFKIPAGWSDPENYDEIPENERPTAKFMDASGRPLNPRGRTGIAGRGLLGKWGPNQAVGAMILRNSGFDGQVDIFLGKRENEQVLTMPKGFILPGETENTAVTRIVETECGWNPKGSEEDPFFTGYIYDPRQTDNAWVEIAGYLFLADAEEFPDLFTPGGEFEEVNWYPLTSATINNMPAGQARLVRDAIAYLENTNRLDKEHAAQLLTATG